MSRTNLGDSLSAARQGVSDTPRPKIIQRNTFEYHRPNGDRAIRFHVTDIIVYHADGRITLDSGGWKTMSTKDRINSHLRGYNVGSDRGTWFVYASDGGGQWFHEDGTPRRVRDGVPFYDGIVLPDAFNDKRAKAKAEKAAKADSKLKDDIKRYIAKVLPTGKAPPMPGPGDCLYCCPTTTESTASNYFGYEKPARALSLGEATENNDHLREHIRENYLPGWLLVTALRDSGYQDAGIHFWLHDAQQGRRDALQMLRRKLSRYLKKQFGMALGAGS